MQPQGPLNSNPDPSLIPAATGSTPTPPPLDPPPPIRGVPGAVEALLREPWRLFRSADAPGLGVVLAALLAIALAGSLIYGVVVGSFSGGDQYWAAPLKAAAGLALTGFICLPSLYIFGCLAGSKARLRDVGLLMAGLVALVTVLLLGFAPVAWVFSQSTHSPVLMGMMHLVFWLVATGFGLRFLSQGFRHLEGRSSGVLRVWMMLYLVVGLQMTTSLRPWLGSSPDLLPKEKKFFLEHWGDEMSGRAEAPRAQR